MKAILVMKVEVDVPSKDETIEVKGVLESSKGEGTLVLFFQHTKAICIVDMSDVKTHLEFKEGRLPEIIQPNELPSVVEEAGEVVGDWEWWKD